MDTTSSVNRKRGLHRLINAFRYSRDGLAAVWRNEAAFRQEVGLALIAIPLGLWLGRDGTERALLVGSLLLVLVVELLNSAVEAVVDRVSEERHELSKRAKDAGSAAVLVALVFTVAVWGLILVPRYLSL
ncbi:undecaprenol kinase [Burkholderiales bacterium]|nr:MAG: diacylglycerol kinase [Burkholderiales bacterium]CAG0999043.1 undecaprenol kinase [Burkholderiales bacterium]